MTSRPSSITPPDELVEQWYVTADNIKEDVVKGIANRAAQWGWDQRGAANEAELQQRADQELEACCEWLQDPELNVDTYKLRAARRPKSPSLKEQALLQLDTLNADLAMHGRGCDLSQIRRALETL